MFRFIRLFISDFVNLLFPTLCLGCQHSLKANELILCANCRIKLPETGQHLEPNRSNSLNKFAGKVPVRFSVSYLYFSKGSTVQKLIHQIKYKGQKEAARQLAEWYGHQLKLESPLVHEIDVLVGVPLHKSRFQQRGYNQADLIAEGLSKSLEVPARTDILVRKHFRGSQTRKNRIERWENVKSEFVVVKPEEVKNKNVVVVDDVLTTGATLEACAIELLNAGCRSVGVLTIAATHR